MKRKFIGKLLATLLFAAGALMVHGQANVEAQLQGTAEISKLRAVIEANPNDLAAHEAYLKTSGFTKWGAPEDPEFVKQYMEWMKKFPTSAVVPYALGHAYAGKESPKAKPYLLKAVEIDPGFDKAYFDLWIDAERWGDFKAANTYLLKAKQANPKSADYAFYYANSFSNSDFEQYRKLSLEVASEFPNTERGAQALYWLANRSQDPQEKIKYYEQQRKDFPAERFSWTSSGMSSYFDLVLQTDAQKALQLAKSMEERSNERGKKTWQANIATANNIIEANSLLSQGKSGEAAAILEKVAVPRYSSSKEYILLLKCRAMDADGKTEDAYKNLLLSYVKEPTQSIKEKLLQYGKKVGKDAEQIDSEVWYVRDTTSKQAPNFTLENYFTKSNSSLSDYRGKVILLTYWFPGCGPCRGEFPHFENVVTKFKNRNDFVYLGINIVPEQDDYVLPFMKSSGYSFTPLKDNDQWKKGPLDNRGAAPVNFLIDQNGKIIFSNFRTDGDNEATLEMMISSMLNRNKNA